jgi:hypothetical protein
VDVEYADKEVRHGKDKAAYGLLRESPWDTGPCCKGSGRWKVNILAFVTTTSGAEGSVQVVVDNVNRAKKALDGVGRSYTEAHVLNVELPHVPGALGYFAGKLAAKEIDITSGFATSVKGSKKASAVFAVSDLDRAARVR